MKVTAITITQKSATSYDWIFSSGLAGILSGKMAASSTLSCKIADFGDYRLNQLIIEITEREKLGKTGSDAVRPYLYQIAFQNQNLKVHERSDLWSDISTTNGIYGGHYLSILHIPFLDK